MEKASVGDRILARLEGFADALKRGDDLEDAFTCRTVVLDLKPRPYTPLVDPQVELVVSDIW